MSKFFDYVATCPPPNGGRTHGWMLGAANHAAFEELDVADAERAILDALGARAMAKRGEVRAALQKAYRERGDGRRLGSWTSWRPKPKPAAHVGDIRRLLDKQRKKLGSVEEEDFVMQSPVNLPEDDGVAAAELIRTLFRDDELVYVGDKFIHGDIFTAAEWRKRLEGGATIPEHVCLNPLTTDALVGHDGVKYTVTSDNVKERRWLLGEIDTLEGAVMPLADQRLIWWELLFHFRDSIGALIFTGHKSVHGCIRVADDTEAAAVLAELIRWGCDPATGDKVRKSRLPGGVHSKTGGKARLLYLGKGVRDE